MSNFLIIALLHFLAVIAPGPDFVMVVKNAISFGKRIGIYTALGIALGIIIHISYCVLGFAFVISKSILIFSIIKYFGAAYLIYIGIKAVIIKDKVQSQAHAHSKQLISISQAIQQGFLCNALNPKASLFFLSLFTLVLRTNTPLWVEIGYGVWMVMVTFVWFAFLTLIINHSYTRNKILKIQPIISKLLGVLLLLFGISLLFVSNT